MVNKKILKWGESMQFIIIILFILFFTGRLGKVPANTVLIIDRNSHYLKTKRYGWYFLLPSDKITTMISTSNLKRTVTDTYETDDGYAVSVTVTCQYKARNLDNVLLELERIRRSIDDIIKSATFYTINGVHSNELRIKYGPLTAELQRKLSNELAGIEVSLSSAVMFIGAPVLNNTTPCYKPRMSDCKDPSEKTHKHYSPVNSSHNNNGGINSYSNNNDGPIKYY